MHVHNLVNNMSCCDLPDADDATQQTNRLIDNYFHLSNEVSQLRQRFDSIESHIHAMMNNQGHMMRLLNRMTKREKPKDAKRKQIQKSDSKKNLPPTSSDTSKLLNLQEALQKNIRLFTENVLFSSSNIPDDLVSSECLSEDECSVIRSKPSPKDQMRLLVRKMKARPPEVIVKFLDIVGKDHPELPKCVYDSAETIEKENTQRPKCVICVIESSVDLKDIGDYLWESGIIPDAIYEDICECEHFHTYRQLLWRNVLNTINNSEYLTEAKGILVKSLTTKYDHLIGLLEEIPEKQPLTCYCRIKRRVRQRPEYLDFGNQTDFSSTSDIELVPRFLRENDSSDESSSSLYGPQSMISYENLDQFNNINNDLNTSSDKTSCEMSSDKISCEMLSCKTSCEMSSGKTSCEMSSCKTSCELQSPLVSSSAFLSSEKNQTRKRHSSGKFVPQKTEEISHLDIEEHAGVPSRCDESLNLLCSLTPTSKHGVSAPGYNSLFDEQSARNSDTDKNCNTKPPSTDADGKTIAFMEGLFNTSN